MNRDLVDPELRFALDVPAPAAIDGETLKEFRKWVGGVVAALPTPNGDVRCEARIVPGPVDAPDVKLLIYKPAHRRVEVLPAILHFHGGGYISGDAHLSDAIARTYALDLGCVVVSVDYRLAPETRYPGPVEDGYAALAWLHTAASELGIDTSRIAVAGGGVAAGVCLLARDREQFRPCFQYLSEPMLDPRSADSDHPNDGHVVWTREQNRFGWSALLGDRHVEAGTSQVPPALVDNLTDLPPTFLYVGAIDLFFEETVEFARRLSRAGVSVELHIWPGAFHAFRALDAHVSREACRVAMSAMRRALRDKKIIHPPKLIGTCRPDRRGCP